MRLNLLVFVGLIFILSSGCTATATPTLETDDAACKTVDSPARLAECTRIEEMLEKMTLDEKIGQMTQVETGSIKTADITQYFIGSILGGGGASPSFNRPVGWVEMMNAYQDAALKTRLAIPMVYGTDVTHGHGNLYGATIFPQQIGLGATRNADLVYRIGQASAEEMMATGVRWTFSPLVSVTQDIRWGRTYETYSEDTTLVSELGAAFIKGLQDLPEGYAAAEGQEIFTLATPKHYLGDGGTAFGTSTQFIMRQYQIDQGDMHFTEAEVRELFLPVYQEAVNSGALSVMVSFSSWNGVKMHEQGYWITDVLKGELGLEGLIVSDWGGIDQVDADYYQAVVKSINAGIDMNMVPYDYVRFIDTMKQAVESGDIALERIDDAVRRILKVKLRMGLFEHPYSDQNFIDTVASAEHRELARQAVRESLVLLKNEHGALPVSKDTPVIFVAGAAADDIGIQCGGWTIDWQGKTGDIQPGITVLEGIQSAVSSQTQVEFNKSGDFAGTAPVGIVVLGEKPYAEGVGDQEDLSLASAEVDLIRAMRDRSERLIVILLTGRPLVITEAYPLADAWVAAWLPGTEGGNGIGDVIFGDYPFTGTLPFTWPRSNQQLPINVNNLGKEDTGCAAPLFPFGYGLGGGGSQPIEWIDCSP